MWVQELGSESAARTVRESDGHRPALGLSGQPDGRAAWEAFVAALALFPNYVGHLLGGADRGGTISSAGTLKRVYAIHGMTCAGCATSVRTALEKLPGVTAANVSYKEKTARVYFKAAKPVGDDAVVGAVQALGFQAVPAKPVALGSDSLPGREAALRRELQRQ